MTLSSWMLRWSKDPCRNCGATPKQRGCSEFRDRLCGPCRLPEKVRPLAVAGVPRGTVQSIQYKMGKVTGDAKIAALLHIVHPRVMENVTVMDGKLYLADPKYRWVRRQGWIYRKETT